jgi:hypothetical protein
MIRCSSSGVTDREVMRFDLSTHPRTHRSFSETGLRSFITLANSLQCAQRVVEGAVLLHEEDNVLGVGEGGAGRRLDGNRTPNGI